MKLTTRRTLLAIGGLLTVLLPSAARAGTWVAYGPQAFVRTSSTATTTVTFSVLNPNTLYYLHLNNGGLNGQYTRSTGVITLNGVRILGQLEFNTFIPVLDWPILLGTNNQLTVELRGTLGSGIMLQVIGFDFGAPTISGFISPPPNAAGWNNSNVTVSFTCADKTSGVASCPAPVTVSNEGANQVVTGTVVDKAGNKATASVAVKLDKTPPLISSAINPPADTGGWNTPPVTVSFTCSDAVSGIATCSPPVSITSDGTGQVIPGIGTDLAGNVGATSVTVNISTNYFQVQNYGGKCLDYGPTGRAGNPGVFLNDCALAHPIRVEEINDTHEVVLHAGAYVIGIPPSVPGTLGDPPPPLPMEYPLELQAYTPALSSTKNQIFRLDGDSIILEGSMPCLNRNDSLCVPADPQFVIQVKNAHGANGSEIVAGRRNLSDNGFWDFNPLAGSRKYPTNGFFEASTNYELWNHICADPQATAYSAPVGCNTLQNGWGKVIVISDPVDPCSQVAGAQNGEHQDVGPCIDLSNYGPLILPEGITLRGDRRGTKLGPQLYAAYYNSRPNSPPTGVEFNCQTCMLQVHGDYVRITGLRIRGQSRSTDKYSPVTDGIEVDYPFTYQNDLGLTAQRDPVSATEYIALIDHNDISDWMEGGVNVQGGHYETLTCDGIADDPATLANVRVERNFLHHNERKDFGYGAAVGKGGRAVIAGNTFLMNRHSIAGDGEAHGSYRAASNLVLSSAPKYFVFPDPNYHFHDFDMHGVGTSNQAYIFDPNGFGGKGGYYIDIAQNTFFGTNRTNYELRGYPCKDSDIQGNVFLQSEGDALNFKPAEFSSGGIDHMNIYVPPEQFELPPPTVHLGVGDFDHDGLTDIFLATGAAWYYAPAANAEWRFLSAKTDTIDHLLFGDFDGDGRTDVIAIHNGQFVISWAGISDWEVFNADPTGGRLLLLPDAVSAMAVGDFNGDGIADIFWSNTATKEWSIAYGGNTPFVKVNDSSFSVQNLRFGDFDGDGATDVFGILTENPCNSEICNAWSYSKSATGLWADGYLREALTTSLDNLVVADFNGDGIADVAYISLPANDAFGWGWSFSYSGTQDWYSQAITADQCSFNYPPPQQLSDMLVGIGRFRGERNADVLMWGAYSNDLCLAAGGAGPAQRQSRQDMR